MFTTSLKRAGLAALVLAAATSSAFAHLNPVEHGGLAGEQPHAFGPGHILATVVVLALVVTGAAILWRRRRAAAEATTKRERLH